MKSISDYSLVELRRVIALKEKISALHGELEAIIGEVAAATFQAIFDLLPVPSAENYIYGK